MWQWVYGEHGMNNTRVRAHVHTRDDEDTGDPEMLRSDRAVVEEEDQQAHRARGRGSACMMGSRQQPISTQAR